MSINMKTHKNELLTNIQVYSEGSREIGMVGRGRQAGDSESRQVSSLSELDTIGPSLLMETTTLNSPSLE